jgi:hypothetical protein
MSSNLLLLIEISGVQHLGQKKGQKVALLTFYLFMRFIQIKPKSANSACK